MTQSITFGGAAACAGLGGIAIGIHPIVTQSVTLGVGIACRLIVTVQDLIHLGIGEYGISILLSLAVDVLTPDVARVGNSIFALTHGAALTQQISHFAAGELLSGLTHHIGNGAISVVSDRIRTANCAVIVAVSDGATAKLAHHAADIGVAADGAAVIAVGHGAIAIIAHHAANIGTAADAAGVIAVGHSAIVTIAHHAADSETVADAAAVTAARDGTTVVIIACHAADSETAAAADAAAVIAARDGTKVIFAHNAADIITCAADAATVMATHDGAIVIIARHAADIGSAADADAVMAARDGTTFVISCHATDAIACGGDDAAVIATHNGAEVIAHHAADIGSAADVGILDAHILNYTAVTDIAKQANIACSTVVEVQAADGLAVTVKGAGVLDFLIAHGGPGAELALIQSSVFCQDVFIDEDVFHELTVDGSVSAVDLLSKPVQLTGITDLVGIAFRAAAGGRLIDLATAIQEAVGIGFCGMVVGVQFAVGGLAQIADLSIDTGGSPLTAGASLRGRITTKGASHFMGSVTLGGISEGVIYRTVDTQNLNGLEGEAVPIHPIGDLVGMVVSQKEVDVGGVSIREHIRTKDNDPFCQPGQGVQGGTAVKYLITHLGQVFTNGHIL